MSYAKGLIQGLVAGAVLTYVFDPQLGRTRRAQLRDKAVRATHEVEDATRIGGHDLVNRSKGVLAGAKGPQKMLGANLGSPGGKLVLGAGLGVLTLLAATFGSPLGIVLGGAAIVGLARSVDRRQEGNDKASAALEANMTAPESTGGIVGLREAYGTESEWTPAAPVSSSSPS